MNENKSISQKNSNKVILTLYPWSNYGFLITYIHLFEKLGNELAFGYLGCLFSNQDDSNKLITELNYGNLVIEDHSKDQGITYNIPIYITKRKIFNNTFNIDFICIEDKGFLTDRISNNYDNITDAINSVYPGVKDIRVDSDIDNNTPIYQTDETCYNLCKRLIPSYKKDIIYSFGMEGLLIKDTIGKNSFGKDENQEENLIPVIGGTTMASQINPYSLNYNKYINTTPFNPWKDSEQSTTGYKDYSDLQPKNCRVVIDYTNYSIVGTDYYQMYNNYNYNNNFLNSNYYSSLTLVSTTMPLYKLGDVICYNVLKGSEQKLSYPFTRYLVASNEFFYSTNEAGMVGPHGYKFEWTTKLLGLDKGTWSEEPQDSTL